MLSDRDAAVVGRSSQVRFSMHEDRLLSREHFRIEVEPPQCILQDLGSTNGTKINGLRVESTPLRNGDVITAGDSAFDVVVDRSTSNGTFPIYCLGCGRAAPEGFDTPEHRANPSEPVIWLCDQCESMRRRFPETHPDYLIERRIGGGGMGEVFFARQLSVNRPVAIKMMPSVGVTNDRARDYFRREMLVLKDLLMPSGQCHPNIVAFYDIFELDGQFQLIMEYVAGRNALEWVSTLSTPLPYGTAARIGRFLLSALDYSHSKGYVHRDVKPSNLLIVGPPHRPQVKLSDFGLAKSFRENEAFVGLTHQGDIGGSIGFLSPDHIRDFRDIKESADLFSAGATLYYLLTLNYPYFDFDPRRNDAYSIILENPSVPLRAHRPDAPEGLERLLRKALEKNPKDRWKSAMAMSEALKPFLDIGV
ncbi:protein kinase domain-containing protein [Singulisphaera sp. PoT]|uniref:protein kinase domain-containing protein n=1 Tax=Singulisphaera sp. PoT TaxID=3411797 RepID=UPI003BF4D245